MADYFYTVESCVDQNVTGVFSSTTEYSVGQVLSIAGPINCYTIIDVTTTPIPTTLLLVVNEYNSCIECIQAIGGTFDFQSCSNLMITPSFDVASFLIVPQDSQVYSLLTTGGTLDCFTSQGFNPTGTPTEGLVSIEGPYVNCPLCVALSLPQSANTEINVCEYICVTGGTGSSVVVLTPPHPQYSNAQGNSVTQLNMITLGGFNGLNS